MNNVTLKANAFSYKGEPYWVAVMGKPGRLSMGTGSEQRCGKLNCKIVSTLILLVQDIE